MVIQLTDIEKSYRRGIKVIQPVLKKCCLKISQGEMIAIIGKSGVGKSTLLHILGLSDDFDDGSYILAGEDISKKSKKELAKLRNQYFGYVMQDFALIPHMNVYDNIAVPLYIANQKKKEIDKKVTLAAELAGISTIVTKKVNELSGGQKQRVAIARAFSNNPPIILADEPTGALDIDTGQEIMEVFHKLSEMGKTIIIVTHDEKVACLCDKVFSMINGNIIGM